MSKDKGDKKPPPPPKLCPACNGAGYTGQGKHTRICGACGGAGTR